MKKFLLAFGALLTVSALPVAHADSYWHDRDGRVWYGAHHIQQDRGEMRHAYWKRSQDVHEYWLARNDGDWDAMHREQMEIGRDNAWIAHQHRDIRHDRWERRNGDDD